MYTCIYFPHRNYPVITAKKNRLYSPLLMSVFYEVPYLLLNVATAVQIIYPVYCAYNRYDSLGCPVIGKISILSDAAGGFFGLVNPKDKE